MTNPRIDTGDIDAKFAEVDARLAALESKNDEQDARLDAVEAGGGGGSTPPPSQNRVVGETEPTAANTGLNGSSGGSRSTHNGDLICQAGKTYEDIDVEEGHVILAPGCIVRRVTATGRFSGGTYYSAIYWGTNAEGALVEDCVARPSADTARVSLNGFGWSGKGYTARWNDVSGVTDLFHGTGDDMVIEANYTHHYRFDSSDPDQGGGWCHPDGVQILGGNRVRIVGNTFELSYDEDLSEGLDDLLSDGHYDDAWGGGFGNGVTLTLKNGGVHDWLVAYNWFKGGEVQLQMPKQNKGYDTGNDGRIEGNRVYVSTTNRWHSGSSKHHFRADSGTGRVSHDSAKPDIDAETGKQLPGTYDPLSIKTPV